MKIGILTSGGDCPGINAAIRGVCKSAFNKPQMEVIGINNGFQGLLTKDVKQLTKESMSGLFLANGTLLGSTRETPFLKQKMDPSEAKPAQIINTLDTLKLDGLVCIGGNGTQTSAYHLSNLGIPVITIPKTIDNDIRGTDYSFGFDSAVNIATDAIDRLHSTASSHKRVMVIEVMGDQAGWIALHAGMAGGGDVILIPEIPYTIKNIGNTIFKRLKQGKPYSIVVVAEGIKTRDKKRAAHFLAEEIEYETGFETRETVLGYVQRGGTPTSFDRNLATRMGGYAIDLLVNKQFGRMVALQGNTMASVPLSEVANTIKYVPMEHELIIQGRNMDVNFG